MNEIRLQRQNLKSENNPEIASAPTEKQILNPKLNFDDMEKEKINIQNEQLDKLVDNKQNSTNI